MQGLSTGTIAQLMQGLPAAPPYYYQIMGACVRCRLRALVRLHPRLRQLCRLLVHVRRHEGGGVQGAEPQRRPGEALPVSAQCCP